MQKKVVEILLILCFTLSLVGCGHDTGTITDLSMLEGGKTFAVPTGTIADQFVLERFPDAKLSYYNTVLDCAVAVKEGKADAAAYDKPVLHNIAGKNEGLTVLPDVICDDNYGFGVRLDDHELKAAADKVIDEIRANGTYDEMMKRWFPEKGAPAPMPEIELTGNRGTLRFGTAAVTEPMAFLDSNHRIAGFDIELASYIAREMDMQLEVVNMDFGGLIPALVSGKVDMIGAGLSITEERAKQILFSESYYAGGIAALVRDDGKSGTDTSGIRLRTIDDIKDKRIAVLLGSVHDTYVLEHLPTAEAKQYKSNADIVLAVKLGKVDVGLLTYEAVRELMRDDNELAQLGDNLFTLPVGMGFNKGNDELREQFNQFLKEIKADGTHADMVQRWIEEGNRDMPVIDNPGNNGVLVVGAVSDKGLPFCAIQDNQWIGLDIELVKRFGAYLGKKVEFQDMEFGSLIAAATANKVDMIASTLVITEERQKQVDFSDPYYELGTVFFALKKNIAVEDNTKMATIDDIDGKRLGVMTGTIHDKIIADKYPSTKILRFDTSSDLVVAIKSKKIDAAMMAGTSAEVVVDSNPDLGFLVDDYMPKPLGMGFNKNNPALRDKFNAFLK